MKNTKPLGTILQTLLLVITLAAVPGKAFCSDLFHFYVQNTFVDQGVEPDAAGYITALHHRQGQTDTQRLDVIVRGLMPATPYELDALVDGNADFAPVDIFMTDANGAAALHYQKIINGSGHLQGNGRGKLALPAECDPVNMVIGLAIVNTNVQPVLAADLLAPDHMQIQINRNVSTPGIPAVLTIRANDARSTIKIAASGLVPNRTYALAWNDTIANTNNASGNGRVSIESLLPHATDVLHLYSVSLRDGTGTVINAPLP